MAYWDMVLFCMEVLKKHVKLNHWKLHCTYSRLSCRVWIAFMCIKPPFKMYTFTHGGIKNGEAKLGLTWHFLHKPTCRLFESCGSGCSPSRRNVCLVRLQRFQNSLMLYTALEQEHMEEEKTSRRSDKCGTSVSCLEKAFFSRTELFLYG